MHSDLLAVKRTIRTEYAIEGVLLTFDVCPCGFLLSCAFLAQVSWRQKLNTENYRSYSLACPGANTQFRQQTYEDTTSQQPTSCSGFTTSSLPGLHCWQQLSGHELRSLLPSHLHPQLGLQRSTQV